MRFFPGQKVVFIKPDPGQETMIGQIFTVEAANGGFVDVHNQVVGSLHGFFAWRFIPYGNPDTVGPDD